jgi:competence protein ComEA
MRRATLVSTWIVVMAIAAFVCGSDSSTLAAQGRSSKSKPTQVVTMPVNLNTATVADLQNLPGIGAATAKLIIEHRQKIGGFKKIEELMNVKGIGEKTFLKLKPMVTVGDKPAKAES